LSSQSARKRFGDHHACRDKTPLVGAPPVLSLTQGRNPMDKQTLQRDFWNRDKSSRRAPTHPVVKAVYEPMALFAAKAVTASAQASVLDIGCGNGYLQYHLERLFETVVGIDFSPAMLARNPCRQCLCGDCTRLPFTDGSFDVVIASHLLHHLEPRERLAALSEMKRVAACAVLVFEPNRNNPLSFLFAAVRKEERGALANSRTYIKTVMNEAELNPTIIADGWLAPNKSPEWSIPLGRFLNRTPLRHFGLDLWAIAWL
jgi:SAM-dependent methyltransferase